MGTRRGLHCAWASARVFRKEDPAAILAAVYYGRAETAEGVAALGVRLVVAGDGEVGDAEAAALVRARMGEALHVGYISVTYDPRHDPGGRGSRQSTNG